MATTTTLGAASLMGVILAAAMVAGLMFCFAHSVMPGLGTLEDLGLPTAFQRIDAAISNPWMMLTFLGSPALYLLLCTCPAVARLCRGWLSRWC